MDNNERKEANEKLIKKSSKSQLLEHINKFTIDNDNEIERLFEEFVGRPPTEGEKMAVGIGYTIKLIRNIKDGIE